jgi:hypothetical protein
MLGVAGVLLRARDSCCFRACECCFRLGSAQPSLPGQLEPPPGLPRLALPGAPPLLPLPSLPAAAAAGAGWLVPLPAVLEGWRAKSAEPVENHGSARPDPRLLISDGAAAAAAPGWLLQPLHHGLALLPALLFCRSALARRPAPLPLLSPAAASSMSSGCVLLLAGAGTCHGDAGPAAADGGGSVAAPPTVTSQPESSSAMLCSSLLPPPGLTPVTLL